MFLIDSIRIRRTKNRGRGVFATKEIEPGVIIGDYLGIITRPDESPYNKKGLVYDMWYSDVADINPDPRSKGVHLLNTSCEPNCAMAAVERHTVICSLRRIFPGEELTYDYFLGDQGKEDEPGTDNCHCGSLMCRGTMYSNPAVYDAWDAFMEQSLDGLPQKPPVAYGDFLPPLKKYPRRIADNPIHPLFGHPRKCPHPSPSTVITSTKSMRKLIRESGRKLYIAELGIVIEGILFNDRILSS